MRPESAPHLYDPSMVPNLLPFSAAVTTGGGSTPTVEAKQGLSGFASMLGLGTTPVTQGATGEPVSVAILPMGTAPLLGLNDDGSVQPVDVALPEMLSIADATRAPVTSEAAPDAVAVPKTGQSTPEPLTPAMANETVIPLTPSDEAPVATVAKVSDMPATPAPAPTAEIGADAGVPGENSRVDADPAMPTVGRDKRTPVQQVSVAKAGIEVIAQDAVVADPAATLPAAAQPIVVKQSSPAPNGKEMAAPEGDLAEQKDDVVSAGPVVEVAVAQPMKSAEPVVATQIVTTEASAPMAEDEAESGADPAIAAPLLQAAPDPVATASDATPDASQEGTPAPAASQPMPVATPVAAPAPIVADPAMSQPPHGSASAVAAPAAETARAPAAIATELPTEQQVEDGTFDTMVTAEADSPADGLRSAGEGASDAMTRDGNRQPTTQSQHGATSAPAPAAPVAAFDPLAIAPAPDAARATSHGTAGEPHARASAIGEDVGLAIVRHADTGSGDVLVIRLDPAELGKIEIRLRMDEARQLTADVRADQPATLDLLRRDSDNLTRALNDAGFRTDDQSLRFDQRGSGQNDQQAQQGRRVASHNYLTDDDAIGASLPTPVQVRSSGRVNLVA